MKNKKYVYSSIALATFLTLAIVVPAFADNNSNQSNNGVGGGVGGGMMYNRGNKNGMMKRGVYGTVAAASGNTITVTSKQGPSATVVTTTYTVDATNAKIMKNGVAGTIASILVGDTITAQGTLTGTNLVATTIRDGVLKGKSDKTNEDKSNQNLPAIVGNGQPIVAGTVSSVSGVTVTITNKSNVSYTIDATNAKITQGPNTITVSGIAVGDMVVVQGTINGNAVVATSVIDQAKVAVSTNTNGGENGKGNGGFFGGIGSFFSHLFGF
jgi:hypothetical protein